MIRRILRLWALYAWMDFTWMTRDLKFFLTYFISDLVLNVTAVTGMLLLAERFGRIGPWSRDDIIFMLGYSILARGLVDLMFGFNVAVISRRVGRGQLDHALIQPQPIWLGLLTEGFNPCAGSAGLIPAIGLLVWAGQNLGLTVTPAWLGLFLINVAASCAIILSFNFTWGSLAFWAPRAAEEINSSTMRLIDQLKSFPLDGIGPGLLAGLIGIVPVAFVAWYPSRALLGLDQSVFALGTTPVAAIILAGLATVVFRKGMEHYGHTGSQRYLSMGHRS